MRFIVEGLAGMSWIAGVLLLLYAVATGGLSAAYNVQVAIALFLSGIFLQLYIGRDTE
jgi:hypothetical protein